MNNNCIFSNYPFQGLCPKVLARKISHLLSRVQWKELPCVLLSTCRSFSRTKAVIASVTTFRLFVFESGKISLFFLLNEIVIEGYREGVGIWSLNANLEVVFCWGNENRTTFNSLNLNTLQSQIGFQSPILQCNLLISQYQIHHQLISWGAQWGKVPKTWNKVKYQKFFDYKKICI